MTQLTNLVAPSQLPLDAKGSMLAGGMDVRYMRQCGTVDMTATGTVEYIRTVKAEGEGTPVGQVLACVLWSDGDRDELPTTMLVRVDPGASETHTVLHDDAVRPSDYVDALADLALVSRAAVSLAVVADDQLEDLSGAVPELLTALAHVLVGDTDGESAEATYARLRKPYGVAGAQLLVRYVSTQVH